MRRKLAVVLCALALGVSAPAGASGDVGQTVALSREVPGNITPAQAIFVVDEDAVSQPIVISPVEREQEGGLLWLICAACIVGAIGGAFLNLSAFLIFVNSPAGQAVIATCGGACAAWVMAP